ncbi:MAG: hypothetical protein QOJ22_1140, partial [Thermoleophilaceae bacterium]|nr:hypothetical protein [Thermoleophilaceae bacterium]
GVELGAKLIQTGITLGKSVPTDFNDPVGIGAVNGLVDAIATYNQAKASGENPDAAALIDKSRAALEVLRDADEAYNGTVLSDRAGNAFKAFAVGQAIRDLLAFRDKIDKAPEEVQNRGDTYRSAQNNYLRLLTEINEYTNQLRTVHCPDDPNDPNPDPNPQPAPGGSGGVNVENVTPNDPNDVLGPKGVGPEGWIPGEQDLAYTIRFENLGPGSEHNPQNLPVATAPAVLVTVTHVLDSDVDLDAVELGDVGWGDVLVPVPAGLQTYHADVPQADGDVVRVDGSLDRSTRTIRWELATIDPETGEIEESPMGGFLPPEDGSGNGQGFVSYGARGLPNLAHNTEIAAQARIVFDRNEAIDTPVHTNKVDAIAPVSSVTAATQPSGSACEQTLDVTWSGSDTGSGLGVFDIWVSTDGGEFLPWRTGVEATSGEFTGEAGRTYSFYSVARDAVGLDEAPPAAGDVEETVVDCDDGAPFTLYSITGSARGGGGWYPAPVDVHLTGVDGGGGSGVTKVFWAASGASSGDAAVDGDETTVPVGNEGVTLLDVRSRDGSGNEAAARRIAVRLDFNAPGVDLRAPAEGAQIVEGSGAVADFSCSDAGSGIQSCDGTVGNGARLDTNGTGEKTLTVAAVDRSGRRTEVARHYTVVPAGGSIPPDTTDRTAPTLTASLTNRRFRVGRGSTATSAAKKKKKAPLGTTFRIRLSEPAAYTIRIEKVTRGVKVGKRCLKPSKRRKGKKCTIAKGAGTLSRTRGLPSLNSLKFSGRIGKKALKPGSYRAKVTATDVAGNRSAQKTVTFTVVR